MKRMLVMFLTVVFVCMVAVGVFADPQHGGTDPFKPGSVDPEIIIVFGK